MVQKSFECEQCGAEVGLSALGTRHRNHCPECLWSKHLDGRLPGDREAVCKGMMRPVGLVFKKNGTKTGEIMVVHKCMVCGGASKNRIAGDDKPEVIEKLFKASLLLSEEEIQDLKDRGMELLTAGAEREIIAQLYGKPEAERRFGE